ncbi:Cof-type HAD-IIB family hydrolase [Brachyspira hampsonii]|uniref:Hydrolase n=1 Tax=Brachyspira hampsonii TaxID=1287055 RepID=A0AAC9TS84_9SPIR|nr:Cof-type HAD-IIB family hydrolase [Brachyspira hampsonii]ASJ20851.1 hydrolase [Brachyspira hampsonii]ELV04951.1 cof family hydrolase [Brachyspira hampsonii 30599]OEJ18950.1 hydrolase [Brachyspira hampsonii]
MNISKEKIKLIAADLDGTLLNGNKEISEYNQQIIKKLINEYNINFILSSGRPYEGIKNYNEILENNTYSIIFNGASIADNNGKIIFRKTLDEDASKEIIELSKKYDVCIHVYDNGKYIVSKEDFPIKSYVQRENKVNVVMGLENINDYRFDKMLILGQRDILEKLKKEIDELNSVHTCFSGTLFLEAVDKEANKGNALKWICENKKIDIKDTIAFGDNFNDIEMIEYSGIGVAMENAEEIVKQKADYVTLSNEEDGVGRFLKNFFEL